ncbi:hypothetical protein O1W17_42580 [Streptomyces sp. H34-S5]|nr:hypothetical protein [Streptomyces sp. H34-AA3]MCZ4088558.1 hypothetical protein [Streptomyces sp. H34-S5]
MTCVRRGLHLIQSFVAARLERLAPELAGLEDRTVHCTRCNQDTQHRPGREVPHHSDLVAELLGRGLAQGAYLKDRVSP